MKNKIDLKRCLLICLISLVLFLLAFLVYDNLTYRAIRTTYNEHLSSIITILKTKYPQLTPTEIADILNGKTSTKEETLAVYGVDIENTSAILEQDELHRKYTILGTAVILVGASLIVGIFLYYIHTRNKKLQDIIDLIARINAHDYSLDIESTSEDELSILKSELYKTTIVLKEAALNSQNDKLRLKDALSDISHQLKTPLTSIMISLDNLEYIDRLSEKDKKDFLKTIQRETSKISFLVQSLLKLSKLDTNTIDFHSRPTTVDKLVESAIANVELIADLKNVPIEVKGDLQSEILCDPDWQVEALSNILKNAIEHSKASEPVLITAHKNKIYTSLSINNRGGLIDKKDLPHIFTRFYKGKNATTESVGIGLALAKAIIDKEDHSITVDSNPTDGVTFTIKYFHK